MIQLNTKRFIESQFKDKMHNLKICNKFKKKHINNILITSEKLNFNNSPTTLDVDRCDDGETSIQVLNHGGSPSPRQGENPLPRIQTPRLCNIHSFNQNVFKDPAVQYYCISINIQHHLFIDNPEHETIVMCCNQITLWLMWITLIISMILLWLKMKIYISIRDRLF